MGIWSSIASSIIGTGVVPAAQGVANIIDQFVETPDEKAAAEALKLRILQEPDRVQSEINKIEAGSRSIFVAGWRPMVGWIGALGLAFPFLINPILQWITGEVGPQLPVDDLMSLVLALLGLGAYRTIEKGMGKAK